MSGTMLKDNHWTRLILILLELNIYDKGNLRQTAEGIVYQMVFGRPWHDLPPRILVSTILSTKTISFGFVNAEFLNRLPILDT